MIELPLKLPSWANANNTWYIIHECTYYYPRHRKFVYVYMYVYMIDIQTRDGREWETNEMGLKIGQCFIESRWHVDALTRKMKAKKISHIHVALTLLLLSTTELIPHIISAFIDILHLHYYISRICPLFFLFLYS